MMFMNRWEVEEAHDRYRNHPLLGPATATLANLMHWADANSDGWAYWPKPTRAAAPLMKLIQGDAFTYRDTERVDVTTAALKAALRPVKAFRTRQNADFTIVESN